jgi:outer membrane protein assembly factor BamD (BamD/ComL family)
VAKSRWKLQSAQDPAERRLCSFTARVQHAAALSVEEVHEAIRLYRALLLAKPPAELLPAIYCGLGNASYRKGDLVDALVYWELYREYCPEAEESALQAMIAILRKPLP